MKTILVVSILFWVFACSGSRSSSHSDAAGPLYVAGITTDSSYGYTQKNPIKVGGVNHDRGPLNEHTYLRNLSGANGEAISYWRLGSCCNFKTPNGIFGGGLLDIYRVARAGVQDTVVLYINMYDADTVWAPIGFQFK